MNPMHGVRGLLAAIWLLGAIAAFVFAQYRHIAAPLAIPIALAFLVEISLYACMERLARWPPVLLFASALAPYLIYVFGVRAFRLEAFALVAALAAVAVWWLAVSPRSDALDLLFLAFMAAAYLTKILRGSYPDPLDIDADTLGKLMWIRLGVVSVLHWRPSGDIGFGFIPTKKDWRIGLKYFAWFLPVGIAIGLTLRIGNFGLVPGFWYKAPAAFIGVLWTVALAEEFFFRGMVQARISKWTGMWIAIALASVTFGLAHLWFGNRYPNWKQVAVATALGLFCGRAFVEAKAIRASMVTHALAVGVWRGLFS
jgi:membrane protease YdiL (CAAX protease family)